ncbi:MAG TPA: hypothetical protein VL966_04030 [Alphaproteobacteria bacterium]|nr:hypothetical protein [Alphaproteobacteria bacterium]
MLALARRLAIAERRTDRRRRLRRAGFVCGTVAIVALGALDGYLLLLNYGPELCESRALAFLGSAKAHICAHVAVR